MMRQLVVWCPDWPVAAQAGGLPADAAVAVMARGQVVACSAVARQEGVRRGMRRRDAQARCPGLTLVDHVPEADARAFERVLGAIEELSPGVTPLRPGLAALAVPHRYYGGEAEAAAVLTERIVELGVWEVRCGIADTLFAAEQAARAADRQDCVIVPERQAARFLADLPVEVLGAPGAASPLADLPDLLRRLGLTTVGNFAALPPADVHTRFGSEGALVHRMARGLDPRPLSSRRVPPELACDIAFEPALDRIDTICFSTRRTAESFVTGLANRSLVATAVSIEVIATATEDAGGQSIASQRIWRHPRWFTSADLVDRVRWQLVAEPPGAPVVGVRFVPETAEPLGDHAETLFGAGTDDRVERQVARVQSILGPQGVLAAALQGGRGPAERQLTTAWGDKPVVRRPRDRPWPGAVPAPAPATVFAEPVPMQMVGAEGAVVVVTGRGVVRGEPTRFRRTATDPWQPVAAWAGPWPVDADWWDEHAARRVARFQVVGVDGSAWLMLVENGRWWAEARYD